MDLDGFKTHPSISHSAILIQQAKCPYREIFFAFTEPSSLQSKGFLR